MNKDRQYSYGLAALWASVAAGLIAISIILYKIAGATAGAMAGGGAVTAEIGYGSVGKAGQAGDRSAQEANSEPPIIDSEMRIRAIIVENLGVKAEAVRSKARLVEDLGADSLDLVELVMALEEEFDIEIPDTACAPAKTVGDIVSIVEAARHDIQPAMR